MARQHRWETHAGLPTHSLIYSQLLEKLIECQELCAMKAHLHNTEGNDMDKTLAKGWLGMTELMKRMQYQITELAKNKLS